MEEKVSLKRKGEFRRNWSLYLFLLPAVVFALLFSYIPMLGILIAFQRYDPFRGLFGSSFVGWENFRFFFSGGEWLQVTVNTLYLNILFILSGTLASIVVAIFMTEIKCKYFTKPAQTLMTLPNFVSWASVALFATAFLNTDGVINRVLTVVAGEGIDFYSDPAVWPATFVIIRIWKGAGWGAILYMAAIVGIDPGIFEAAKIDGASRFRCIFTITLPLINNTIILLLIMSIGNIFRGDFGMIYPFIGDNYLLFPTTDVIDTYVFRALRTSADMGRNMAISLYQSVMGLVLVLFANRMAKTFAPDSALF